MSGTTILIQTWPNNIILKPWFQGEKLKKIILKLQEVFGFSKARNFYFGGNTPEGDANINLKPSKNGDFGEAEARILSEIIEKYMAILQEELLSTDKFLERTIYFQVWFKLQSDSTLLLVFMKGLFG